MKNLKNLQQPILWGILLLVALVDLAFVYFGHTANRYFTKTLLLPLLGLLFFVSSGKTHGTRYLYFYLGLFFSFLGDLFLLKDSQFLLGLGSFFIAHVFYILSFYGLARRKLSIAVLVILALYVHVVLVLLYPNLKEMKIPVVFYIGVIYMMFLTASRTKNIALICGALFFVVSDSVLAYTLFYASSKAASMLVMVSYVLAQSLLVVGMVWESQNKGEPLGVPSVSES